MAEIVPTWPIMDGARGRGTEAVRRGVDVGGRTRARDGDPETAALARALAQVGDRWTLRVVHALLPGAQRFGELQRELGVAPNVLTQRLRTLEADGLVLAEPYQQRPPRHAYRLTARGRELGGVLRLLAAWAVEDRAPRHGPCGTDLEVRWWCPTCDRTAGGPDDEVVRL